MDIFWNYTIGLMLVTYMLLTYQIVHVGHALSLACVHGICTCKKYDAFSGCCVQ